MTMALAAMSLHAADVKQGVAPTNIRQSVCIPSAALGMERCYNVLLPADYEKSMSRYPVLYLLHGYGDDHTAWSYMTNLSDYAANKKIIVVMPDGSRSWYVNSAADPKAKFEDFLMQDLVPHIDSQYRTIPLPRSRAVAGLSMGGYGAAFLGIKHYKKFAAIGAFSGAVGFSRSTPPPTNAPPQDEAARRRSADMQAVFGAQGSEDRKARDPFELIEKVPLAEMPALYIACGGQDFLLQQNRDFVALLAKKKIPYEYREISPRAHTWDFWDDHVKVFLGFLKELPGFKGI